MAARRGGSPPPPAPPLQIHRPPLLAWDWRSPCEAKEEDKGYSSMLVSAGLALASRDFPPEVRRHGAKMLQHLQKFRPEELSSADLLSLIVEDALSEKENPSSRQDSHLQAQNISYIRFPGLSFDTLVDQDDSELDFVQKLMSIDLFSYDEFGAGYGDQDNITASKKFHDIIHPRMLRSDGIISCNLLKGCLLLEEHNILCESFCAVTPYLRNEEYKGVLPYLLNPINKIWAQSEWKSTFLHHAFGLTCLFSDRFLEMSYDVLKFCENELHTSILGDYLISLLKSILPFLLQLLHCIHALWRGQIACSLSEELETAKSVMSDEKGFQENKTRELLEEIRESGYTIIGLALSLEGAFSDLLDISSFSVAFMEDLGAMEFRHLSKLINLVFLPLVKYCPCDLWKEWMLNLLRPLLNHCEELLYLAWFSLLHYGRAKVPYYFGKLSGLAENSEKLEEAFLLEFTREVSYLLGALSSPQSIRGCCGPYWGLFRKFSEDESNLTMTNLEDPDSLSSRSLIGYLSTQDCFGGLRMSLFGYLVDGEAARGAILFCRALVSLAGSTNNKRLMIFAVDELLPSVIRRLDDQLPCAMRDLISKLNSSSSDTANKDLIVLCKELFHYLSSCVYPKSQDLMEEDQVGANAENNFACWLEKQKENLRAKASRAAPTEFRGEWNWEFDDEFQRYLPVYINMLQEVDAMDDSLERDYLDWEVLLQKLKPEFRSKYGINSSEHPHLRHISHMRKRKFNSMTQVRHYNQIGDFLSKLITLKPYIKASDHSYRVIERLEETFEICDCRTFDSADVELKESVYVLLHLVLYFLEPRFHPLIREGHKDFLLQMVGQLTNAKVNKHFQPLVPDLKDFLPHLEPYAQFYFETKLKLSMYARAMVQIHLHEEYDNYLASGELDSYIEELVSEDVYSSVKNYVVSPPFSDLDHDLIKLSLKRRAQIVQIHCQITTYSKCLRDVAENESLKGHLTSLISELKAKGFFDVDSERVDWENECFSKLIEKFNNEVFAGHSLPKQYIIQGIIDFQTILLLKDSTLQAFEEVVAEASNKLISYLPKFWRDTQYYEHDFYGIIREPLKKIFV